MNQTIYFHKASEYFDQDLSTYHTQISNLLSISRDKDPTLVLHTVEAMAQRFQHSIVCVLEGKLIGHCSVYPTSMHPLQHHTQIDNTYYQIGELGSCVVHPLYQDRKLWTTLVQKSLSTFADQYSYIISATINPYFTNLAHKIGFSSEQPFPRQYYEEWQQHLSWLLAWWVEEFSQRATFLVYSSWHPKSLLLNFIKDRDYASWVSL